MSIVIEEADDGLLQIGDTTAEELRSVCAASHVHLAQTSPPAFVR